jgi:hypothetical protein
MDKESKLEEEILASFEREEWRSVPNLMEGVFISLVWQNRLGGRRRRLRLG